jgi:hypothetical protein
MDIVERLRGFRYFDRGEPRSAQVCLDAAEEIDRLRKELAAAKDGRKIHPVYIDTSDTE